MLGAARRVRKIVREQFATAIEVPASGGASGFLERMEQRIVLRDWRRATSDLTYPRRRARTVGDEGLETELAAWSSRCFGFSITTLLRSSRSESR